MGTKTWLALAVAALCLVLATRGTRYDNKVECGIFLKGLSSTPEQRKIALAGCNSDRVEFNTLKRDYLDRSVPDLVEERTRMADEINAFYQAADKESYVEEEINGQEWVTGEKYRVRGTISADLSDDSRPYLYFEPEMKGGQASALPESDTVPQYVFDRIEGGLNGASAEVGLLIQEHSALAFSEQRVMWITVQPPTPEQMRADYGDAFRFCWNEHNGFGGKQHHCTLD